MKKYIVSILSFILIILIITGCEAKKVEEITDAEKVSIEYNVSKDNQFIYATYDQMIDLLKSDGIIYFGYPEEDFCKSIVEILTDITKGQEINIHYYNPRQLVAKDSLEYQQLLDLLDQDNLNVPAVYFVKEGKIIDKEVSLSKRDNLEYLTKEEISNLKKVYREKVAHYLQEYTEA